MKKYLIWVVLLITAFGFLAWAAANPSSQRSSKQMILKPSPRGVDLGSPSVKLLGKRAWTSERSPGRMPAGVVPVERHQKRNPDEPSPHLFFPQLETLACDDGVVWDVDYNGVDEWNEAVRLTPSGACSLIALLFWPSDPDTEAPGLTWGVWDDDGPGGLPSTLLDTGTENNPDYDQWFRVDLGSPIFIPFGDDIYIGWLDENSVPYYVNGLDAVLDSCNYWYDGVEWLLDPWFDGDFLIHGIVEPVPVSDDVGPISVTSPGPVIPQGTSLNPEIVVRNLGTNTATFDVICDIDSSLILVYSDTVNITGLSSLTDTSIIFSAMWNAANAPGINYQEIVYTTLVGDENPGNDTLMSTTVTYDPSKVIQSPYTTSPPTIDGFLTPGEWSAATTRDVSDLLGTPDAADAFGSAAIYVMNDAANLYMAVDAAADPTVDDFDQIAPYFDDNNDHAFPSAPDTSEGNYWLWKITGADSLSHRWIQAGGVFGNEYLVGYPGAIGITSGHQQFELQIPLGILAQELNASAGDTVGFFILAMNGFDFSTYGWWPYDTDPTTGWYTPSEYGDIILEPAPIIHDGAMISIDSLPDTLCTDSTYTLCVTVVNFGNVTETFDAHFSIPPVYDETTTVTDLAPSETTQVCFPDWTVPSAPDSNWYTMTSCVLVPGDTGSANDCKTDSVFAYMCEVGIEEGWKVLAVPRAFALGQSSPNPFNHRTDIRYQIPVRAEVSLKVYDPSGRLVKTLRDETQEPGYYTITWDGKDQNEFEVPSGIYLYRLKAGEFLSTRKLIMLR